VRWAFKLPDKVRWLFLDEQIALLPSSNDSLRKRPGDVR
jgi:hypothetical protein